MSTEIEASQITEKSESHYYHVIAMVGVNKLDYYVFWLQLSTFNLSMSIADNNGLQ